MGLTLSSLGITFSSLFIPNRGRRVKCIFLQTLEVKCQLNFLHIIKKKKKKKGKKKLFKKLRWSIASPLRYLAGPPSSTRNEGLPTLKDVFRGGTGHPLGSFQGWPESPSKTSSRVARLPTPGEGVVQ